MNAEKRRPSAWATPCPSNASATTGASMSHASFPDLATSLRAPHTRRARANRSIWNDSGAASAQFNPYPSRVDEMNARASHWRRTGRVPRFDGDSRLVLDGREQCEEGANDQGYAQVIFRDKSMGSGPMANGGAWACMFHAAQTGSIASRAILHGINGAAASSTTALLSVHGTSSSLSKQRPQTFASDASTSADGHDKQVAYKKRD